MLTRFIYYTLGCRKKDDDIAAELKERLCKEASYRRGEFVDAFNKVRKTYLSQGRDITAGEIDTSEEDWLCALDRTADHVSYHYSCPLEV